MRASLDPKRRQSSDDTGPLLSKSIAWTARPPDLKGGALQPRSRAVTAGRGPDRENWKPYPITALKTNSVHPHPTPLANTLERNPPTADTMNRAGEPNQNIKQEDGEK